MLKKRITVNDNISKRKLNCRNISHRFFTPMNKTKIGNILVKL